MLNDLKLKAGVWWRERKERAEERKAASAAMNSEHGHGRFFLLHVPAMATICAAVVEWYWAILFCIEATGGIDWNYETAAGSADREATQAAINAAADNARSTIDTLATAVDATPEELNIAATNAQEAAQALAAAVNENGVTPAYGQAYADLVAAVEAAQPADVSAAAEAARAAISTTAEVATTGAPLLNPSTWNFAFETHWPIFLGLVCATIPIVMLSMVWLPVQFAMRGTGMWRRGTVIAVGVLANILVIVSGTVVMNGNRQEQVRAGLVVEQQAQANRGAIQAQIDAVNEDLARLTDRRINNEYAATAANVGAEAYRAQYMSAEALARSPEARRDIIVRALGAAERADALRAERTGLFQQLAQAPTEAAVAVNVEDEVGAGLNSFAQIVEVWRPPFVAVICCLIGIFGAWWVLALMQGLNPRDVLRSGWADESHRIEDLREEEPVVPQSMKPAREVVKDTDTDQIIVDKDGDMARVIREHTRKVKGKDGKPIKMVMPAQELPDETGVTSDGGNRTGMTVAGPIDLDALTPQTETPADEAAEKVAAVEEALPDLSDEELAVLPELSDDATGDAAIDSANADPEQDASADDDGQDDHAERTEPETDERKLIAAE